MNTRVSGVSRVFLDDLVIACLSYYKSKGIADIYSCVESYGYPLSFDYADLRQLLWNYVIGGYVDYVDVDTFQLSGRVPNTVVNRLVELGLVDAMTGMRCGCTSVNRGLS